MVVMKAKSGTPLTKWSLYLKAMKPLFAIGTAIVIFFIVLARVLSFVYGVLPFFESILLGGGVGVFFFILIAVIGSPVPLRGVLLIAQQEAFFKFHFCDEMQKNNITKTNYKSFDWFIDVDMARVVVLRRDYISKIDCIGRLFGSRGMIFLAIVITADGKKINVQGSRRSIQNLEKWFLTSS